ncbi:hypothetical protein GCM10009546_34160 [Actinomadura livida]|uniref:Uncharacterized protein n=1 Tax=Actinomadura livida TaxID=79909 RepID=A0ABP3PJN6_9ACTN|nr:hypothetical protein GCM10010208_43160 [Actinomadura livida]
MLSGASSQWADTIKIAFGFGIPADQRASSSVHTGSSASGGAPWLRYKTGIRVMSSPLVVASR